ncbi:MAG: decaprenyl-phosphate phosphoribosyltransferase [Nitrospirae bacterium]|nr:decaprenyl-phosphate phosphoribosyltransferase [Nitrospirota bacterium]
MNAYIRLLRPRHWIKNLFIFATPFFAGRLFTNFNLKLCLSAFIGFSLAASSIYILNDIRDYKTDIYHPNKKNRPIAAGIINKTTALIISGIIAVTSLIISYKVGLIFLYFLILYMLIQIAYSLFVKDLALGDIFSIASGFVIRVLAGGAAFNTRASKWLMLTMFMISIVLAVGKRFQEIALLNNDAPLHRKSASKYSKELLNEYLMISSGASLIAYSMYTIEQQSTLVYTVPVVMFGLFRYLMVAKRGLGDPTEALTKDRILSVTVIIWLILVGFIGYAARHGGIMSLIVLL